MDYESHPNRPPSEQMVDLHVYVVPPALWQERLHSAFNQIIGETVSAGFIRVFPESLLQHVRNDIERQLGYEIVPRNFVFCKSVGRCLTQVRSRQEKELKVKHFLPPHAYCPEIFVLDYDIARRSQTSSDGSVASNRSYGNSRSHTKQQRSPRPQQNMDSPRQTQRSKHHHQRLSETTVYHGKTPKVAHKGVTGVYIGPYPMQSYPGLGSRPGTADSQSRSPVPFDSGRDNDDFEELERERQRRIRDQEAEARRRQLEELEARRKAEEEEERRRREEEERRRREEEECRRREEEERRRREEEERRRWEEEERRRRDEEERRRREEEERRRWEEEERRRRDEEERRRREEEERRRWEEEEEERLWREAEAERRSGSKPAGSGELKADEVDETKRAQGSESTAQDESQHQSVVAMATEKNPSIQEENISKEVLAEEEAAALAADEDDETGGMVPNLLIEEATSIDPQEEMRRERELLLAELQRVRDERSEIERRRDDLIRRARQLQARTQNMRNQGFQSLAARDIWKKRYFEEKKLTTPLEDQANRLREELESYHKRMVSTMTSRVKDGKNIDTPDATQQLNLRIQATRMQHEIEELQRRVDDSKMKLTAEVKLRTQAEAELRAMKAELTQRKLNLSMTRTQQMGHLAS